MFGNKGRRAYFALTPGQPLLLSREPDNPIDTNAIRAATLFGEPVGYVAREDAKIIAPQMDNGVLWLGKVTASPIHFVQNCRALLWSETPDEKTTTNKRVKENA